VGGFQARSAGFARHALVEMLNQAFGLSLARRTVKPSASAAAIEDAIGHIAYLVRRDVFQAIACAALVDRLGFVESAQPAARRHELRNRTR
jgi:hypothetical protein